MKVIICHKIEESEPEYFKRAWRIPYKELENLGWISVEASEIHKKLSIFFIETYQRLPSIILFWNVNSLIRDNIKDILQNKWKKMIYFDDLHQTSNKIIEYRNMIIKNFDYLLITCAYVFKNFYPITPNHKIVWYPHNVHHNFHTPFNYQPVNRIILSGVIEKTIYPFRYHISRISKKYPIDVLEHLSYKKAKHKIFGHRYIKYLNKYIAGITCCSCEKTPYIVAKFFEIPASGALLMAYDEFVKEPLSKLGFVDGENYISVNFKNIEEKIKFVLDKNNRELIDKIRLNGYNLIWNNHTLTHRVQIIDDIATNKPHQTFHLFDN